MMTLFQTAYSMPPPMVQPSTNSDVEAVPPWVGWVLFTFSVALEPAQPPLPNTITRSQE